MNPFPNKPVPAPRGNMPAFGTFPTSNNASILLEKANPGLRRSTPDSEALASSDDEDQARAQHVASKAAKAPRRTSWLNEMPPRRTSNTMSGYSPNASHPNTPSTELGAWAANPSPSLSGSTTWTTPGGYPWGSLWSENRKDPVRRQEVLPSPIANKTLTTKFLSDNKIMPSLASPSPGESSIPFSIPLQPTPKTYRSQSYSVGQLDTGAVIPSTLAVASPLDAQRSRFGNLQSGLQRRSSRPGILHEGGLEKVREGDADEELLHEQNQASEQAQKISQLEHENAQLRQASEARDRAASSGNTGPSYRNTRPHRVVPEEELAVDDGDDFGGGAPLPHSHEREDILADRLASATLDPRGSDSARKAHWQTSLGFGPVAEPPQSRRHSFADVPTRHGSFSSTGKKMEIQSRRPSRADVVDRNEPPRPYENMAQEVSHALDRESPYTQYSRFKIVRELEMEVSYLRNHHVAAQYFHNHASVRREAEAKVEHAFASNPYGRYHGVGSNAIPGAQSLYIVNFKCNRADVFYVQEGTGIQVHEGDLVIVEADRGTDLGAVSHANVTWEQARCYKEHYAEEHYKLLMIFSMQARNGGPNVVNPNGLQSGSAVGGMGPPGQHPGHEASHNDLKPKMIRRKANPHEILAIQEKEGNEAKAKRVCQQKVQEHGLHMEILDAEFQMDSKKLTFYYFADNYINFNSLVTDLFKIYKTRIWMSAINPASFITPTASLAPTAYSGQGFGTGRQSPATRRRPQHMPYSQQAHGAYEDSFEPHRGSQQRSVQREQYYGGYPAYETSAPQNTYGAQGYHQASVDPFTPYVHYPMLNATAPNFAPSAQRRDVSGRDNNQNQSAGNWMGRFPGLSLGS